MGSDDESKEMVTLGKSIIVPSVQELAKQGLSDVPDRYVVVTTDQNHPDRPILKSDLHPEVDVNLQVPIINMELLTLGDEHELQRLHLACQEWGFFQLINHGVGIPLLEKFKVETQEFFNLPQMEKKRFWQTPKDVEGFGQSFVVSEDQRLDWADLFYLVMLPKSLRKPYLFPMLPLPFRETLEEYSRELQNLGLKLLECFAKALKIEVDVIKGMFTKGEQAIRMNYYPPCPQPDKVIGLTPHSDSVGFTILLQLNEIQGLQIMKDDIWIPINPLPNAFIVNIGDILEILSNGIYRSIMHRAVVNAAKKRLSVAAFHSPALDQEIGPISTLITPKTPPKFKQIGVADYWKGLFARPLHGKSYLDLMKINNNEDTLDVVMKI